MEYEINAKYQFYNPLALYSDENAMKNCTFSAADGVRESLCQTISSLF
jgi:hypothetical protein